MTEKAQGNPPATRQKATAQGEETTIKQKKQLGREILFYQVVAHLIDNRDRPCRLTRSNIVLNLESRLREARHEYAEHVTVASHPQQQVFAAYAQVRGIAETVSPFGSRSNRILQRQRNIEQFPSFRRLFLHLSRRRIASHIQFLWQVTFDEEVERLDVRA